MLKNQLDKDGDGTVTRSELYYAGRKALEDRWARELFLEVIEKPKTAADRMGNSLVTVLDYGGTALFAVVGTQLAGEAGMNIVGCSLVGCIAAMGGGTLNNLLYASSSPILGNAGVFWVRIPAYLATALGASIFTFFAWPLYCERQAEIEIKSMLPRDDREIQRDGKGNAVVDEASFVAACERDGAFVAGVRAGLGLGEGEASSSRQLFRRVDTKKTGYIDLKEMQVVVGARFDASPTMYALDSAALSGFAVAAVHGAVGRGLHPLVAASSGVTICFGGILRDVLCKRDLAIGGQSYAFATGAGSTAYVLLRELRIRGIISVPLPGRIIIAAGTCAFLRWWEYVRGVPLLSPMHGTAVDE